MLREPSADFALVLGAELGVFGLRLSRQRGGVFVRALSETAFHSCAQRDGALAEFVAQAVGGGQNVLPLFTALIFQEIELRRVLPKRRSLHAEQPYLCAFTPVGMKQPLDLLEDFVVELRRRIERVRAGDGGEIFVAQFQL